MIDLVITHPWGPPWTLATLGDMLENDHFGGFVRQMTYLSRPEVSECTQWVLTMYYITIRLQIYLVVNVFTHKQRFDE